MIDEVLNILSVQINQNFWLAPILVLLAGIVTSLTPCSLSSIPLIIGYVGGRTENTKKGFKLSVVFAVGGAISFTILGIIASIAGNLIGRSSSIWYIILGILMLLMALQTWELIEIIPSTYLVSKNKKKGYVGALIAGILSGIFSSPCATPVLIVILAVVAGNGNILWGILLLLIYSVGHGTLAIVAGTSIGFVKKIVSNNKFGIWSKVIKIITGILILIIGLYMLYLGF